MCETPPWNLQAGFTYASKTAVQPPDIKTKMKLTRESWIILTIGLLDLASTLLWVTRSGAQEANPIFRYYLAMGPVWFIAAKCVCLMCPVLLLEFARRQRPRSAMMGARFAIIGYLLLYAVGTANLNPELGRASKSGSSAIMDRLGTELTPGRFVAADHTFLMPMNATDTFPLEGLR